MDRAGRGSASFAKVGLQHVSFENLAAANVRYGSEADISTEHQAGVFPLERAIPLNLFGRDHDDQVDGPIQRNRGVRRQPFDQRR